MPSRHNLVACTLAILVSSCGAMDQPPEGEAAFEVADHLVPIGSCGSTLWTWSSPYGPLTAFSNGADQGTGSSCGSSSYGYGFQCVELVERWVIHNLYHDTSRAMTIWGNAGSGMCSSAASLPQYYAVYYPGSSAQPGPGDILEWSYTHTAVVVDNWVDSGGQRWIGFLEQNEIWNSTETMATYNVAWSGGGFASESCWIHPKILDGAAPSQLTGNDAYSFVNWPDGHMEVFPHGTAGDLLHVWTNDAADSWHAAATLDSGAECGSGSVFWPSPYSYAEIFSPRPDGTTGHLWWSSGSGWNTFQPYGGTSLSHLQTLTWADGHSEVFALGPDHAIWHDYWNLSARNWSGWQSLGGTLATGPAPMRWGDGHGEIFATDATGTPWHVWSTSSGWSTWASMATDMPLATRPVPVRWADGHLELFATGQDGHLYHSAFSGGAWPKFTVLDATTDLLGEPSVVMNVSGKGASPGPEVFARDATGHVVHLWWTGSAYTGFTPLFGQVSYADPFAWLRSDGTAEVFALTSGGSLVYVHHNASGWGTWQSIATGIDACTTIEPAQAVAPPDTTTTPAAATLVNPPGTSMVAGGCSVTPAGGGAGGGVLLLGLALLAAWGRARSRW